MTFEEAKKIALEIEDLFSPFGEETMCLDGHYTADQLEAIAIMMRAATSGGSHD